jgi:hypothetical protein
MQAHLRMKADMAWETLEKKVSGVDEEYRDMHVFAFIATLPIDENSDIAASNLADASCIIPANGTTPPEIVVGTLDINQGAKLPAEELVGRQPESGNLRVERAYLSNVCVLPAMRRKVG